MQNLSPRADWLYLMRLDDLGTSLFPASLSPAPGLTASSCSYGREFATRCFQLHLAATPCASLRLPSSAPVGSFHPTRFCPCWAHRVRPSGRTFSNGEGPASAAEGCLSQHKRCPQGLKPVVGSVINVRAEARTLQKSVRSHADSKALIRITSLSAACNAAALLRQ